MEHFIQRRKYNTLTFFRDFRKNGVASFLLDNLLAHLTSGDNSEVRAVYLHVLTTNSQAISFYEHRGFRPHLFLPYYYNIKGEEEKEIRKKWIDVSVAHSKGPRFDFQAEPPKTLYFLTARRAVLGMTLLLLFFFCFFFLFLLCCWDSGFEASRFF